ncbi:MAG: nickel-dependent lactate racemase, partial [Thermoplasmata archaeon]|nr:nickel-dependent lactate racemase [Thermoplasmata archaeon]
LVARALESPVDGLSLSSFLEGAGDVIFIVNDGTRPTPTRIMLDVVEGYIPGDVRRSYIVACGSHREPTPEEYRNIFGEERLSAMKDSIFYHDAKKEEDLAVVGRTSWGEEVKINRRVAEASRIIVISSVEPHYFAGFTGGRKSFLPGVAAYDVIERNHANALSPDAMGLRLEGNPVHEQMDEFARIAGGGRTYGVMAVVDADGHLANVFAGDLWESFNAGVEEAKKVYCSTVERKYPVVVTAAPYPMDINLYQAQKAIENGKLALERGGILILVAQCWNGIGQRAFYDLLKSAPTPGEVLARVKEGYKLGYHKAAKLADIMTWAELWAYTDLEDGVLEDVGIRPVHDLQKAVEEALDRVGGPLLFLPQGSITVPLIKDEG